MEFLEDKGRAKDTFRSSWKKPILCSILLNHCDIPGQRLNTALQEKEALDKQKQERLLETVSKTLKQSVTSRLDNTVKAEITNKVVPGKDFLSSLRNFLCPAYFRQEKKFRMFLSCVNYVQKKTVTAAHTELQIHSPQAFVTYRHKFPLHPPSPLPRTQTHGHHNDWLWNNLWWVNWTTQPRQKSPTK